MFIGSVLGAVNILQDTDLAFPVPLLPLSNIALLLRIRGVTQRFTHCSQYFLCLTTRGRAMKWLTSLAFEIIFWFHSELSSIIVHSNYRKSRIWFLHDDHMLKSVRVQLPKFRCQNGPLFYWPCKMLDHNILHFHMDIKIILIISQCSFVLH